MSFDEKIAALIQRVPSVLDHLETEEATKNALVMPFIAALGYDVFNPEEVVPEFVADVGTKRGEKVDYSIMRDGEVILLIECKRAGYDLNDANASQLYRYFSVTKARIAILTNGLQYRFFSDLEAPNRMDRKPFLELDLADPRPNLMREVKRLGKRQFDLERMLSAASELKALSEIKKVITAQLEVPDDDFVRFFFAQVNPDARFTSSAREEFGRLVPRALSQFISEKVSYRLRSALQTETQTPAEEAAVSAEEGSQVDEDIVTTEEELEAYRIVTAIVSRAIAPERVVHRDHKTYMSVNLDDNNRKPICRLWFNTSQRYLGTFDSEKDETRNAIDCPTDIYVYGEQLLATVANYES